MATVKDTNGQRGNVERHYTDDGSSTAGQLGNTTEVDNMRLKDARLFMFFKLSSELSSLV